MILSPTTLWAISTLNSIAVITASLDLLEAMPSIIFPIWNKVATIKHSIKVWDSLVIIATAYAPKEHIVINKYSSIGFSL